MINFSVIAPLHPAAPVCPGPHTTASSGAASRASSEAPSGVSSGASRRCAFLFLPISTRALKWGFHADTAMPIDDFTGKSGLFGRVCLLLPWAFKSRFATEPTMVPRRALPHPVVVSGGHCPIRSSFLTNSISSGYSPPGHDSSRSMIPAKHDSCQA